MVEGTCLENRRPRKGSVGSNPTASAKTPYLLVVFRSSFPTSNRYRQRWPGVGKGHKNRGGEVASRVAHNHKIVGSSPTPGTRFYEVEWFHVCYELKRWTMFMARDCPSVTTIRYPPDLKADSPLQT